MRKIIIIQVIVLIAFIAGLNYLINELTGSLHEIGSAVKENQKYIGTTAVLNGDTLLIIDYAPFNDTYTLSNGVKVSTKLIIK